MRAMLDTLKFFLILIATVGMVPILMAVNELSIRGVI